MVFKQSSVLVLSIRFIHVHLETDRQAGWRDERQKETVITREREREGERETDQREREAERGRKEETEWPSGSNLLLAYKNTLMTGGLAACCMCFVCVCMRMYVSVSEQICMCVFVCIYAPMLAPPE